MFTEALGPNFSNGTDPSFKSARYYFWTSAGIKLVVGERGRVVGIFAWRRYGPPEVTKANDELVKYRTDRDIGSGSPLSAVRTAYGPNGYPLGSTVEQDAHQHRDEVGQRRDLRRDP